MISSFFVKILGGASQAMLGVDSSYRFRIGSKAAGLVSRMAFHMPSTLDAMSILDNGNVGVRTIAPEIPLHVYTGDASVAPNALSLIAAEHSGAAAISILTGNTSSGYLMFGDSGDSFIGGIRYFHNDDSMRFQVNNTEYVIINSSGLMGINGVTSPSTALDLGAGAIEFDEMTAPGAGAANTARLFARDDGGGDTELCVRFNSGLIQVIAPLEFGEISRTQNTTLTALTLNTPAQYLFFDTNGPANGATPDHTNDHITISKTGTYLIIVSLSAESVAGSSYDIEFTVQKNNGATQVGEVHAHRSFAGGGGDFGSVSLSGLAVLTAGDTVELWIENQTSSQDLRIEDATLTATMVGVNA